MNYVSQKKKPRNMCEKKKKERNRKKMMKNSRKRGRKGKKEDRLIWINYSVKNEDVYTKNEPRSEE